ncbi:MAG: DUF885 family protein [Planctomycetes bacterium]|nr:DUF885 family protein [Planctomycetota bacterium]
MRALACGLLSFVCPSVVLFAQQDLRERIELFSADLADLNRRYDVPLSGERVDHLRARLQQEQRQLAALDFDALAHDARIDWLLLDQHVRTLLQRLDEEQRRDAAVADLLPFAAAIVRFGEAHRRMEADDPEAAAATVVQIAAACSGEATARLGEIAAADGGTQRLLRAADRTADLRRTLDRWFRFRDGYDPLFSWWVRAPFETAAKALLDYEQALRRAVGSQAGDSSLVGAPIGEAALLRALQQEWIPYSPAELVAIAEREFAWCDAEMAKASAEMGNGDDWRAALEKVKGLHRAPGEQPQLIKELAHEAIAFLEQRDLITIPELAKDCWRMRMMSPAAQRVNPFFLGGETILVSFPTDAMAHIEKLQSLRSNNEHFCRATVHHELIPGHWLQQYSQARYRTYRAPFDTPFWIEGWALYWEMRLYGMGFAKSAEDRVGMLYWRKHRCARIVFSLNFHLGRWTGPECVKYLIDRVGHEPAAAEGEVRRSVSGGYGPLYQAAYMLGGLQIRALHDELVVPGSKWTERAFHDAVLRQNAMPIAVLRAALQGELPPRQLPVWRFAE